MLYSRKLRGARSSLRLGYKTAMKISQSI